MLVVRRQGVEGFGLGCCKRFAGLGFVSIGWLCSCMFLLSWEFRACELEFAVFKDLENIRSRVQTPESSAEGHFRRLFDKVLRECQ